MNDFREILSGREGCGLESPRHEGVRLSKDSHREGEVDCRGSLSRHSGDSAPRRGRGRVSPHVKSPVRQRRRRVLFYWSHTPVPPRPASTMSEWKGKPDRKNL